MVPVAAVMLASAGTACCRNGGTHESNPPPATPAARVSAATSALGGPGSPTIAQFLATDVLLAPGERTTLRWTVTDAEATALVIDDGTGLWGGPVTGDSVEVTPGRSVTYVLTATGKHGSTQAKLRVEVTPAWRRALHVDARYGGSDPDGTARAPYPSLEQALDKAREGDAVLVAQGTYSVPLQVGERTITMLGGYPGADRASYASGGAGDFSKRDVQAHRTILQGNPHEPVVKVAAEAPVWIDGFVIRGGLHGVRAECERPVTVTIASNVIESNGRSLAEHRGGGIYGDGCTMHVLGNHIRNNQSGRGAGVSIGHGAIRIEGNVVEDNVGFEDHGAGLYLYASGVVAYNLIRRNEIGRNLDYGWGGGLMVYGKGNHADIRFNRVEQNRAPSIGSGIFIDDEATATIDHTLVVGNHKTEAGGAGIYVDGLEPDKPSKAIITHCTVADNGDSSSRNGGNGVYVTHAQVQVRNSIFWGNGDDFFVGANHSSLEVAFSSAQESWPGEGLVRSNPRFAREGEDYHVQSRQGRWDFSGGAARWMRDDHDSPCIDAGDPALPFDAEPLPNGNRVNLGFYGATAQASLSPPGR